MTTIIREGDYEVGEGHPHGDDIDRALRTLASAVEKLEEAVLSGKTPELATAHTHGSFIEVFDSLATLRGHVVAQVGLDQADEPPPVRQQLND